MYSRGDDRRAKRLPTTSRSATALAAVRSRTILYMPQIKQIYWDIFVLRIYIRLALRFVARYAESSFLFDDDFRGRTARVTPLVKAFSTLLRQQKPSKHECEDGDARRGRNASGAERSVPSRRRGRNRSKTKKLSRRQINDGQSSSGRRSRVFVELTGDASDVRPRRTSRRFAHCFRRRTVIRLHSLDFGGRKKKRSSSSMKSVFNMFTCHCCNAIKRILHSYDVVFYSLKHFVFLNFSLTVRFVDSRLHPGQNSFFLVITIVRGGSLATPDCESHNRKVDLVFSEYDERSSPVSPAWLH